MSISIKQWFLIGLCGLLPLVSSGVVAQSSRPNILLIMTDDQGHGDLGFHGNPLIHTPTLDSLARHSLRLTDFHVSPVCAPTRASLMSGRHSLETGVFDTYRGGATMASEVVTLAELLRGAGYRTGMAGKWHLGDNYPYRPQEQGFDQVLRHGGGGLEQPGDFYENFTRKDSCYFDPYLLRNGQKFQAQGYVSDVFTDAAIDFVQRQSEQPFFFYLAYNAPHTPLEVPQAYLDRYAEMPYPADTFAVQGADEIAEMRPRDLEAARRVYAMVTNIDDNLARLFATLRATDQAENTLVIFLTDNGPQQRRYTSGLYGRKGSVYEGGVKVPCFWHWPAGLGEPREVTQLAAHLDVLPTLAELLHLPLPDGVDGRSLWPVLKGERQGIEREPLFFKWMRGYPFGYHNMAVRHGRYKLTGAYQFEQDPEDFDLFDLVADPFEQNDLQPNQPKLVDSLRRAYDRWLAEVKASPYLQGSLPIPLIAPGEEQVRLNRNDWQGPHTQFWASMRAHGYWWVEVPRAGTYRVAIRFQDTLPGNGLVQLKVGPAQQHQRVENPKGRVFTFDLDLQPGQYALEPWFYCFWPQEAKDIYGPHDVVVRYLGPAAPSSPQN